MLGRCVGPAIRLTLHGYASGTLPLGRGKGVGYRKQKEKNGRKGYLYKRKKSIYTINQQKSPILTKIKRTNKSWKREVEYLCS